jgi:hypothetical protein
MDVQDHDYELTTMAGGSGMISEPLTDSVNNSAILRLGIRMRMGLRTEQKGRQSAMIKRFIGAAELLRRRFCR